MQCNKVDPIDEAFQSGRRAWPGVTLEREAFQAQMEARRADPETLGLRGSDLFLAAACAAGDPAAVRHFEHAFLAGIDRQVGKLALPDEQVEEARQLLRVKFLVGPEPGIREYGGRGPLGAWVRVSAVRVALDLTRAARARPQASDELLAAMAAPDGSPELAAIKGQNHTLLQQALEGALRALTPREKTVLRLHLVDGLNIETIGTIYRVHRATVARWLVSARGHVYEHVRRTLRLELRTTSSELRSMVDLFRADVQLSVRRVLESGRR
jgi:RNA polymerase sigma-70 factor, ECF subfamily